MLRPTPRVAISAIFFLNGAMFSAWYARVPAISDRLDLSPGEIGVALLGAPLGLLLAQPLAGALVARRGSYALLRLAPVAMVAIALPALAVDLPTLALAVLLTGATNGVLDITMNAQGLAVERAAGRGLFASLHAAFSFGALAGAASAGAIAGAGVAPLAHLAAWGAVGAVAAAIASRGLIDDAEHASPAAPRIARPSRRLAAVGAIAFCALLAEGAVFDWSGLYLDRDTGASATLAPMGLAVFSLTMGIGRLIADRLAAAHGARRVVRAGATIAAAGLTAALAAGTPAAGIAGFAVMGFGLSAVFPLTLRAAGGGESHSGPELAAVSTLGYTGFLLGPPFIGVLAEVSGLGAALLVVSAALLLTAVLARALRPAAARA